MKFKAAIFDMDGTLVDSLFLWDTLWSAFGERYLNNKNFVPTVEDDKSVRTVTLNVAMDMIHQKYGFGSSGAELLKIANDIMKEFYSNKVKLKSGVKEFLDYCKKAGTKMCLASATDAQLLKIALKHCDIEDYFLKVFSCGDIGKGKDEPDIFLLAQEFLGESIEDTFVFEDSLTAIETAVKLGMPTVAIYDRYNYGQERMKEIATEYIAQNQTLARLIED